ncbi:MAG: pyrimidine/purine nucleoside phosphorylase [Lachnospiraceae bacterium]|nr:pyrimidine/purine nucleoside phosphorylase [Lachnospiraceae bacterium]
MGKTVDGLQVARKANVYFDGKVTSRSCLKEDGSRLTFGIILPGSYSFGVGEKEIVQIISGECQVLLPNEQEWKTVKQEESFVVGPDCEYQIRSYEVTEYQCDYVK